MKFSLERHALVICIAIASLALVWPSALKKVVQPIVQGAISTLGGGFFVFVNFILLALVLLCLSPLAKKKMGGEQAKIEFSTFGWLAMLFAAGMGSGLVFWGVAEPVIHSVEKPLKQGLYPDNIGASLALTMLNWGVHAWALYGAFGLLLGGVTKALSTTDDISAPALYALPTHLQQRLKPTVQSVIYLIAIVAIFFGVVGTIANASMLLHNGAQMTLTSMGFDIAESWIAVAVLLIITFIYFMSSQLGLHRGIQTLSIINIYLAFVMLVLVVLVVPIAPIVKTVLVALKDYAMLIVSGAWQLDSQLKDSKWANVWTYNYYFWWLAWGPFVGIFLARISRGRPLWQYILGVVFIPSLMSLVWFSVLGGSALALDGSSHASLISAVNEDYTKGVFIFFAELGGMGHILTWLSFFLLVVFVATSADSALLVIRQLCSTLSRKRSLVIWSLTMTLISLGLVVIADEKLNRNIAVIGALPFAFIFIWQVVGFIKALSKELLSEGDEKAPIE
ncbi:BCCT family transporter [Pseudoalteromonas pernae]|uniref:BCCT family transporter n=1 Tax=Pseudoalteromonas pernae TaxID=3118054 RepID=UPI00324269EB